MRLGLSMQMGRQEGVAGSQADEGQMTATPETEANLVRSEPEVHWHRTLGEECACVGMFVRLSGADFIRCPCGEMAPTNNGRVGSHPHGPIEPKFYSAVVTF
jgi:hypothetical protein